MLKKVGTTYSNRFRAKVKQNPTSVHVASAMTFFGHLERAMWNPEGFTREEECREMFGGAWAFLHFSSFPRSWVKRAYDTAHRIQVTLDMAQGVDAIQGHDVIKVTVRFYAKDFKAPTCSLTVFWELGRTKHVIARPYQATWLP